VLLVLSVLSSTLIAWGSRLVRARSRGQRPDSRGPVAAPTQKEG
jgi:hypothetical protein